jgi:hypothetical protein
LAGVAAQQQEEPNETLKASEEGWMALALAWSWKFRTHDLTPVTRPGDGYTDHYHDLSGTLIWRDHSYIASVMANPTRKRPPTATDRDRAGYYKDTSPVSQYWTRSNAESVLF